MRDQSQLDDMRAAIRGDLERARARREADPWRAPEDPGLTPEVSDTSLEPTPAPEPEVPGPTPEVSDTSLEPTPEPEPEPEPVAVAEPEPEPEPEPEEQCLTPEVSDTPQPEPKRGFFSSLFR